MRKQIEESFRLFEQTIKQHEKSCLYNVSARVATQTLISYELLFRNMPLLIAVTRERVEHIKTKDMLLNFSKVTHDNMSHLTSAVATTIATAPPDHKYEIDRVRNQMRSAVLFLEQHVHFSRGEEGVFTLALLEEVQHAYANLFLQICDHRLSPKVDAQYFRNLVLRNAQFDFRQQLQSATADIFEQTHVRQGNSMSTDFAAGLTIQQFQNTVPKIAGVVTTIFHPLSIAFAKN